MKQYLELCKLVLDKGSLRLNRTGVGASSCFGHQMRFNLKNGFPLLTTKKMNFKAIVYELL
jgi:thymidylate synthase